MATTINLPASFSLSDYTVHLEENAKVILRTCSGGSWEVYEYDIVNSGPVRVAVTNNEFTMDSESIGSSPEEIELKIYNSGGAGAIFLLNSDANANTVELIGTDDWRYLCNLAPVVDAREHHRFSLNDVPVVLERRQISGKDHLVLIYNSSGSGGTTEYISLIEIT